VSCRCVALALTTAILVAAPLVAQEPRAPEPRLRIQLSDQPLALIGNVALKPGGWLGPRTTPELVGQRWAAETRALAARRTVARYQARVMAALSPPAPAPRDTARRRIPIPRPEEVAEPLEVEEEPATLEALGRYADLGLDLQARLVMKFDRLRNERCTAADVNTPGSGCQGGFPTPSFDEDFRVLAGGIVAERFHVNVDFDTKREFTINNTINFWYQGLEDEIVRRVEVGNVTFRAPPFRYITAAIPANSFGVQVEAQLGPVDLSSIFAQQKGSAVRTRTFRVGDATTQPVSFEARDLDFESGRFFFVVPPLALPDYPAIDALNIVPEFLPDTLRPTGVRVYRLRAQVGRDEDNPNLGGIEAVALRSDSPQRVGPFSWELLVEGSDYYLDPSGVWFALANRLGTDDFVAVSYTRASGDTVGTFPAVNGAGDTLQLVYEPRRGSEVPTYFHEMRNAYRIGGSGITRETIRLSIVVNESEQPLGSRGTYLSTLGLAVTVDPSTIDQFNRVFPRTRDPNNGEPVRDLFVMFPHLTPFADSAVLAPRDRNDSLYSTPTYLLVSEAPPPLFHLRFDYEASGAGDRSTLSLGALQVRDFSEKLFIGERELVRGRDYEIDYELGQVLFYNPDSLFPGPTEIRTQFEENQLFDFAPKTIFGLAGTYNLGPESRIHAIGLFQRDRTSLTRPQLGFEPQAGFMGGLGAELRFRGEGLTRVLDALPLIETTVPSRLDVTGEVAVSNPNPNSTGIAYIEDFQQEAAFKVPLVEREFQLGSTPSSGHGLPPSYLDPAGQFTDQDAVPLVWQNLVRTPSGLVEFRPQDIDSSIVLTGTGIAIEPTLWLTLKPDTVGGAPDPETGAPRWFLPHTAGPRWRSLTQPFGFGSGVGIDLSRSEFVEFWVLEDAELKGRQQNAMLVIDLGTVFEDVAGPAPTSFQVQGADTLFSGLQFEGAGSLDAERDPLTAVYNALTDDLGIRGDLVGTILNETSGEVLNDFPLCSVEDIAGVPSLLLGNLRAACTRRNRRLDTEDLDGDNRLDLAVGATAEDFLRYTFSIGDTRYFVKEGVTHLDEQGRPMTWRLYRIPMRLDSLQVGQPNLRQIEAMRLTLVTPDVGAVEEEFWVTLARMRFVGAPWVKRADTPIAGISGSTGELHGEVNAATVSTEDEQLGYESPPGTADLPAETSEALQIGVTQVNEKSLRVVAEDLRGGERAEALVRFSADADRNFLPYRRLRVWARGRGTGWAEGDLQFFIKVGQNENNFYMYRAPARTDSWEPEVVVDLKRWLDLRAQIESAWLAGTPPTGAAECGGDSTAYVACDGPYLVHVRDPGVSPPNLARVSEIAAGILRVQETAAVAMAELWVNDIRLDDVVGDAGIATAIDVRLAAADVAEFDFGYSMRDDRFHQFDQRPSYVTDAAMRFAMLFRADKLLPQSWGLSVPFTLRYAKTSADPFFLQNTDVLADQLTNLRQPKGSVTSWDVTVRRVKRGETAIERTLVDPVTVQVRGEKASDATSFTSAQTRNKGARVAYDNVPGAKTVQGAPAFLINLVNSLPDWISESEFGKALRGSRLRWNPFRFSFASTFTNNRTDRNTFRVPVQLEADTAQSPLPSIVHTWRNELGFDFRPYSSFAIRLNWASTRDLQDYGDSTVTGRLLEEERGGLFGWDIGFERWRTLTTGLNVAPVVSSWLRPRFVFTTRYYFTRDPNQRVPVATADSTLKPPETLGNARHAEVGASLDLARLVRGIAGDSGTVTSIFAIFLPGDVTFARDLRSSFDRAAFSADLGYRLALGGLQSFRTQDGVPATATGDLESLIWGGGLRLPLGGLFRLSYRNLTNTVWSRRGDTQLQVVQRSREWPSMNFSWAYSPSSGIRAVISSVSAGLQYRIVRASSVQPISALGGSDSVVVENNSRFLTPTLTLSWSPGITTAVQFTNARTETVTSGNLTESEQSTWGASANFGWNLPTSFVRSGNRVQTTIAFNSSTQAVCILQVGAQSCRTVSDSRRDQLDIRLDTGFTQSLRGGMTFSYVLTDQRHTSQTLSQILFTIYADINFITGQVR
jgi:hypothetical protein